MNHISVIVPLVLSLCPSAFASPAQTLLRFFPAQVLRNEIVEFKPVTGHHFSAEAPQNCGSGNLLERGPRAVKCQFAASGQTAATLNVCDDSLTYCRPMQVQILVRDMPSGDKVLLTKNQTINSELHKKLIPGFSEGSIEEIRTEAAKRGQPVFAMVSTDWCPPCNEAKEFLLSSEAFQTATRNWFKVYIDGDSVEAAKWENVVHFHYFPTFVLLDSNLREVVRYTGEYRQHDFEVWARESSALIGDPLANVQERALARRTDSLKRKLADLIVTREQMNRDDVRLLRWALDQDKSEIANRLLAHNSPFPDLQSEILHFRLDQLKRTDVDGDQKAAKIAAREELLSRAFKGNHWAIELSELCDTDKNKCALYFPKIAERLKFLEGRADLTPAEKASALGEDYLYLSEAFQSAGKTNLAKEFALKCVGHFDQMARQSVLKISRAGQQGMVSCLELAGDFGREGKLLKTLLEAYPTEPTFMNRMARMMIKQKKYDKALAWIAKGEAQAYGYNWFMLQGLKVETLLGMKKRSEALNAINGALAQVSLSDEKDARNQSLVAKLRALQSKVTDAK